MGTDAAFATLGIAVGAQPIEITRAFRALSRQSHPDTGGGEPSVFATVVAAYRTLQRAGLVRTESTVLSQLTIRFQLASRGSTNSKLLILKG